MKKFIPILFLSFFFLSHTFGMGMLMDKKYELSLDLAAYVTMKFFAEFGDELYNSAPDIEKEKLDGTPFFSRDQKFIENRNGILNEMEEIFEEGTVFSCFSKTDVDQFVSLIKNMNEKIFEPMIENKDIDSEWVNKIKTFFENLFNKIYNLALNNYKSDEMDDNEEVEDSELMNIVFSSQSMLFKKTPVDKLTHLVQKLIENPSTDTETSSTDTQSDDDSDDNSEDSDCED